MSVGIVPLDTLARMLPQASYPTPLRFGGASQQLVCGGWRLTSKALPFCSARTPASAFGTRKKTDPHGAFAARAFKNEFVDQGVATAGTEVHFERVGPGAIVLQT